MESVIKPEVVRAGIVNVLRMYNCTDKLTGSSSAVRIFRFAQKRFFLSVSFSNKSLLY